MGNAARDDNYVPTLIGVSNSDGTTPVTVYVNPTTHRLLVSSTASPAGSDTQVQFNDGGSLGADAGFTYNKTTDTATLAGNLEAEDILIEDSDASHYLTITTTSNLTAARTLTLIPGDASRSLTITANSSIGGTAYVASGTDVAVADGGTNLSTVAAGSVLGANALDTIVAITSTSGLKLLQNNAGTISWETVTGTGAPVMATSPTLTTPVLTTPDINAGTADSLTSLGIRSTGTGAFDIIFANSENLTVGNKTLTFTLNNASRTLTIGADSSISGTAYVASGTDIALADGGTGASLADPNADQIMMWDDSASTVKFMAIGNGLNIDATPILAADTASDTVDGIVELATAAETTTGTDATRAVTPDGLAGSDYGKREVGIQVVEAATNTATGDGKAFFRVPSIMNGWNLVGVNATVYTAGTTNTTDVQIRNKTDSVDMLSTKMTIDSGETDTSTAAIAAVIDTTKDDVATGDVIAIDVDAVSTTPAQGLFVELIFQLP